MLIFFSDFVTSFCYLMFFLPFFSYNFSFVVVYKRFIDLIKCYWKSGKLIGLIRREVEKKKKLLNKNNNCFCTCYLSSLDKGKKLNWFLQLICFSSLFSFFFFFHYQRLYKLWPVKTTGRVNSFFDNVQKLKCNRIQ